MSSITHILRTMKTIAMVGASPKEDRPSNHVLSFLLSKGYTVYPINPGFAGKEIHGQKVYATLADVPAPVDMVDIFRNTEDAAKAIDEAIALKDRLQVKTIWCQLGVTPHEAAKRAEAAGLQVVMDRCPAIEYPKWLG
jgi:predicted CoA-binding protein